MLLEDRLPIGYPAYECMQSWTSGGHDTILNMQKEAILALLLVAKLSLFGSTGAHINRVCLHGDI